MAQLLQPFNARMYDPMQGGSSLPIGKHPVIVKSSEVKANSSNTGGYLQLNLEIIDGPAKGAEGPYRLNLYHSSAQTVEIANRQLSTICHAIGVFDVSKSEDLHNIPFIVEVAYQKGHAPGEPDSKGYTEVKAVFDINGGAPSKGTQQAAQQQPAQQGGFAQQQTAPAQQPTQQAAWGQPVPQQQAPAAQPATWGQPAQQTAPQQPSQQQASWTPNGAQPTANAPWAAK